MLHGLLHVVIPIVENIQHLPQIYKIYTRRSVEDISFWSLFLFITASLAWMTHGYMQNDIVVIVSSSISLCMNFILIAMYLYFSKKKHHGNPDLKI